MTSPQKDYLLGWMVVLINFATGLRNNQTTLERRTASIPSGRGMGTSGMTWIVLPAISTPVRKVIDTVSVCILKDINLRNVHPTPQLHVTLFWQECEMYDEVAINHSGDDVNIVAYHTSLHFE